MAVEEFADCVATRIGTTVDIILQGIQNFTADQIRQFLGRWRGLRDADRALAATVASLANSVIIAIAGKALGAFGKELAAALVVFLGFAAWGALLTSMALCEPQLEV